MAREVFLQTNTLDPLAGQVAYVMGFFVALIMWGFGLLWFSIALASLYKTAMDQGVPFNMGWWGFTYVFPPSWATSIPADDFQVSIRRLLV
jgi:tellurite resistance protein TehA-like permease